MTPSRSGTIADLREDSRVTLAPDGAGFGVDCRVVGFHRQLMVLERADAVLRPPEDEALRPGALSYLVCGSRKRPTAVRVQVMETVQRRLVLRLLDRFTLGQQRAFSRLEAAWRISLDAGQGPVETVTVDVSAGGSLVRAHDALLGHTRFDVVLALPGDRPPLRAAACLAGRRPGTLALRFLDLTDVDEARVAEVVLEELAAGGARASGSLEDAVGAAIRGR